MPDASQGDDDDGAQGKVKTQHDSQSGTIADPPGLASVPTRTQGGAKQIKEEKGIFYKKNCFDVVISGGCQVVCTSGDLSLRAILVGGELPCLVQLGGPHWGQRGDVNK